MKKIIEYKKLKNSDVEIVVKAILNNEEIKLISMSLPAPENGQRNAFINKKSLNFEIKEAVKDYDDDWNEVSIIYATIADIYIPLNELGIEYDIKIIRFLKNKETGNYEPVTNIFENVTLQNGNDCFDLIKEDFAYL